MHVKTMMNKYYSDQKSCINIMLLESSHDIEQAFNRQNYKASHSHFKGFPG